MVEQYNEAKEEYGADTYQWVINGIHNKIVSVLDFREYIILIRSSLTPLFTLKDKWISDETKAYFNAHGGYENAHKANWTVWDPQPNKKSITTSASGQTGKVIEEVGAGATVDIEGVLYVLHNSNNGGASHAFISEVAKTAVAGKNIVISDYVTYNGKKYPVTEMRGNIFSGTAIKSVKLPSTLTEISNSAFRETPITEIVIPASVKIVQGSAFYGCKNLTKVVFENDVMDEVHGCFQKCINLKNVKFPRRVGLMSYDMFEGCVNLTEVMLPENLSEIYSSMFSGCKNLKNVDIPASVTKVGNSAFSDSGITSLADLAGKSVMAQAASSAVDAINENEDFKASLKEVVELGDYNMGFMDLAQGTVDAVAADLGVAQYQIANNDGDYVILDEPLSTEQYAIGFLKGNTELRDAVNAELLKMAEDGTMLEIAQKYVDQGLVLDSLCLINK